MERGLLTAPELEDALAEQSRSGRLLGQILVERDYLSGFSLTRALTEQHGVELRSERPPHIAAVREEARTWRPLGKLLVANGFLAETELEHALAEQRERRGRLGEILVARGYLTGLTLARALAEQHGLDPAPVGEPDARVEAVVGAPAPTQAVYRVWHVTRTPGRPPRTLMYETPNFLDAADFVSEVVSRRRVDALVIERSRGEVCETVWTYSEGRAAAQASSRAPLVETFGFDPTSWGAGAA